jgi:hypothetical protein
MRTLLKKITMALVLLGTVTALSAVAIAQSCSNASLNGNYVFTIHGQILAGPAPGIVDGIALSTFDGQGKMTQIDAVSHNGQVAQVWRPGTATYAVNPDCTGSMTLDNQGVPPLHLVFLIDKQAKSIHTVVIDPGVAVTSDATRQEGPDGP